MLRVYRTWIDGFNPRTHKGCDRAIRETFDYMVSFNPRTHKGCDCFVECFSIFIKKFQSTHPQRVRLTNTNVWFPSVEFQSTHPQRVRLNIHWKDESKEVSFNPRTHKGCDTKIMEDSVEKTVSIHAPTKGATLSKSIQAFLIEFQSTHPQRVRPSVTYNPVG